MYQHPSISLKLPLHGLRSQLLNYAYLATYPIYARLTRRGKPVWQISSTDLLRLPPGSLGRQTGYFLQANNFTLMPGFENHDVFHTLLDYGISVPEEVALQWCLIGNGKRSAFALLTALIGFGLFPEHWGFFRQAFRRGQAMRPFHHWYFEYLLRENLGDLRDFLNGKPMPPYSASI